MGITNPFKHIIDLALPRTCVVCGRDLILREQHICTGCLEDLPLTRFEQSSHNPMADCLNSRLENGPYLFATALFYYSGGYSEISKALKFKRNFKLGKYFSRMLAEKITRSEYLSDIDLITSVPLHWTRRFQRGYNQAEIIAEELSATLGVEYRKLLKRQRRTERQTGIVGEGETEARFSNVKGAFAKKRSCSRLLKGKRHVLVIDDVFTSGATLSECVQTLKDDEHATTRISVATLAFARL